MNKAKFVIVSMALIFFYIAIFFGGLQSWSESSSETKLFLPILNVIYLIVSFVIIYFVMED